MARERVERRLAAILAADVAGYSRLIGADEEGTLARLKTHRGELIDPKIAEHRGRIVKTTGDGLLVEFASVVDALRCATDVQAAMTERNSAVPADSRIEFRIGIHQGDIVVEDGDIFGDGVNIAARLEGLADPGGICVSARGQGDAAGKIQLAFRDLGEHQLKNIARPVRVFRTAASAPSPVTAALVPLALPDKPSVAVLPFANMSGDPEQQVFADGIAEDVITALSRYPSLFVIARNSCFTYKGRAVDVKVVGHELGVRYVLEGSLRKSGSRIRVTAQLVEAESGKHVWAERYDRDLADIFAVQDEITEAMTIAIAPAITDAEQKRAMRKPPGSLDAWAAYQQAMWHRAKADATANEQACRLFELAIQLDPMFAPAYAGLARAYGYAGVHHRTMPVDEALRQNLTYARKAVELDPGDAEALAGLSVALVWLGDLETALATARQAIAINPNCSFANTCLGGCLVLTGETAEGRAALDIAERLNPHDNEQADDIGRLLAQSYYFDRDYHKCIAVLRSQLGARPNSPLLLTLLARALGQLGQAEEAHAALERARASWGERYNPGNRQPYHSPENHAHLLEGLRKAGWEG